MAAVIVATVEQFQACGTPQDGIIQVVAGQVEGFAAGKVQIIGEHVVANNQMSIDLAIVRKKLEDINMAAAFALGVLEAAKYDRATVKLDAVETACNWLRRVVKL